MADKKSYVKIEQLHHSVDMQNIVGHCNNPEVQVLAEEILDRLLYETCGGDVEKFIALVYLMSVIVREGFDPEK